MNREDNGKLGKPIGIIILKVCFCPNKVANYKSDRKIQNKC